MESAIYDLIILDDKVQSTEESVASVHSERTHYASGGFAHLFKADSQAHLISWPVCDMLKCTVLSFNTSGTPKVESPSCDHGNKKTKLQ